MELSLTRGIVHVEGGRSAWRRLPPAVDSTRTGGLVGAETCCLARPGVLASSSAQRLNPGDDPNQISGTEQFGESAPDLALHPADLRRPRRVVAADQEHTVDEFYRPGGASQARADDVWPSLGKARQHIGRRRPEMTQEPLDAVPQHHRLVVTGLGRSLTTGLAMDPARHEPSLSPSSTPPSVPPLVPAAVPSDVVMRPAWSRCNS